MALAILEVSEKKAPLALAITLLTFAVVCYFLIYYFNVSLGVVCLYIITITLITELLKDTQIGRLIILAANFLFLYIILGNIINVLAIFGIDAIGDIIVKVLLYEKAEVIE